MKREIIRLDTVLWTYYNKLAQDMKEFDRLVILGNSMSNEPHIKLLIKDFFNIRENVSLVVCSDDPSKVVKELKKDRSYMKDVIEIPTKGIDTEEKLIEMFKNCMT